MTQLQEHLKRIGTFSGASSLQLLAPEIEKVLSTNQNRDDKIKAILKIVYDSNFVSCFNQDEDEQRFLSLWYEAFEDLL